MDIAIIADDLTGAADCAVEFSGSHRSVVLSLAYSDIRVANVVAIDTNSRDLPPSAAALRVAAAIRALQAAAPRLWYKKLDSTLRGNVAAELGAFVTALDGSLLLLAPSYPAQGRGLVDGSLQLAEISNAGALDARHLPAMLRPTASTIQLLPLAQVRQGAAAVRAEFQAAPPGTIVIADATTDGDLDILVAAASRMGPGVAFAGSAGLAAALARAQRQTVLDAPPLPMAHDVLLVVGSLHPASRRQLAFAAGRFGPVLEWPQPDAVAERSVRQAAAAHAGGEPGILLLATSPVPAASSQRVAAGIAAAAAALISALAIRRVFCTGGEIARELCDQLGIQHFSVSGRVLEGMPALQALDGVQGLMLVSKAGGFGSDDTLLRAHRYLAGEEVMQQ